MITILLFFIIAIMRVMQAVCNKRVSNELKNTKTFFLYGVYYQALAAVFSLLALSFVGFKGLTFSTVVCAFVTVAFLRGRCGQKAAQEDSPLKEYVHRERKREGIGSIRQNQIHNRSDQTIGISVQASDVYLDIQKNRKKTMPLN